MEYLHGEEESFLDKFSHVEYKRLKKVLKRCRTCCRSLHGSCGADEQEDDNSDALSQLCRYYESCPCQYLPIYDTKLFFFLNFGDFSTAICVRRFMIDGRWKELIFREIETKQLILVGGFDLNSRKE